MNQVHPLKGPNKFKLGVFSANADGGPRISMTQSRVPVWVIPTNEELMIARHTRRILKASH